MRIYKLLSILTLLVTAALASTAVLAADQTSANVSQAEALVRALGAGNYAAAEAGFNARMKQGLPPQKLETTWKQIIAQTGVFQKTGETQTREFQGNAIVLVKTLFKNGALWTQVAFDQSGQISGLYFKPAD